MRYAVLLLLVLLVGCSPLDLPSVVVFGRDVRDIAVSSSTGRDCSIVRLDSGKTYCAPLIDTPRPQPYCTRSLGPVTCWADPYLVPQHQHEVADTPPPTEEQLRYRATRWPKSILF